MYIDESFQRVLSRGFNGVGSGRHTLEWLGVQYCLDVATLCEEQ